MWPVWGFKLHGLCVLHVDDFLIAGNQWFYELVKTNLVDKFTFGKIEMEKFKFTGLNIQQTKDGIFIDQDSYIRSIKPIKLDKFCDKSAKLPRMFLLNIEPLLVSLAGLQKIHGLIWHLMPDI